eukprot:GILJ01010168.1.p1 GENE.GILJ01010168.1~~GILJ01010168.1.p1  ORF type:complete len:141 (-),score=25.03 GILJ01010168.1:110-508(-)
MSKVAPQQSLVVSLVLLAVTYGAIKYFAPVLASETNKPLPVLGGFLSSFIFFFGMIAIGNLEQMAGFEATRWIEVIVCLVAAVSVAGSVHRVSTTVCFLFSIAFLFYLRYAARRADMAPAASSQVQPKKKQK